MHRTMLLPNRYLVLGSSLVSCLVCFPPEHCTHGASPAPVLSRTVPAWNFFSLTSFSQGTTYALLGLPSCKTSCRRLPTALHHAAQREGTVTWQCTCVVPYLFPLEKTSCIRGTAPAHLVLWAPTAVGVVPLPTICRYLSILTCGKLYHTSLPLIYHAAQVRVDHISPSLLRSTGWVGLG